MLQDPSGFLIAPLQVSPAALLLLSLCDGSRTRDDVRRDYAARVGQELASAELEQFLTTMDETLLLDSDRFRARRRALEQEFAALPWRPAAHAGSAYSGDPRTLASELERWIASGDAGGRADGRLRALVAPHIDYHRGGPGYGRSYAALLHRETPEVILVVGTGHGADEGRFILCDKGFATPLGNLPVDREFLARLEAKLPRSFRRGALAHRSEHSIELQAVLLAHLFADEPRPTIVPILATSFDDLLLSGRRPEDLAETRDFLAALHETYVEERRRILVVAGADLSHVGPRFGDPDKLTADRLEQVRARDAAAIEGARSGDARRFLEAVAQHGNRDRICSVAGIYAALATTRSASGDLLVYDQAVEPDGNLAVTFAGLALYGPADGPGLARLQGGRHTLRQKRGA